MFDRLEKSAPRDLGRINVLNAWDLQYWADELGVPPETIIEAVAEVGENIDVVREHVGRHL